MEPSRYLALRRGAVPVVRVGGVGALGGVLDVVRLGGVESEPGVSVRPLPRQWAGVPSLSKRRVPGLAGVGALVPLQVPPSQEKWERGDWGPLV